MGHYRITFMTFLIDKRWLKKIVLRYFSQKNAVAHQRCQSCIRKQRFILYCVRGLGKLTMQWLVFEVLLDHSMKDWWIDWQCDRHSIIEINWSFVKITAVKWDTSNVYLFVSVSLDIIIGNSFIPPFVSLQSSHAVSHASKGSGLFLWRN